MVAEQWWLVSEREREREEPAPRLDTSVTRARKMEVPLGRGGPLTASQWKP